jgi:hypothetical protein
MNHKEIQGKYLPIILISNGVEVILRIIEILLIVANYEFTTDLLSSEISGTLYDIITINASLVILYPIFYLISKKSAELQTLFLSF